MRCMQTVPLLISFLALLVAPVSLVAAETDNPAVAKVGSITITEQDYQRELQKLIPMQVSYHGGIKPEKLEKVQKEALQNLINRAYKFQYALKEEISVDSQEFDIAWKAYIEKSNSKEVSSDELAQVRVGFYQDLLGKRAEEVAVDEKVTVTDEEIKAHYDNNQGKFKRPRLYTASHIFLKVDPSASLADKAKRKEQAQDLYEKALAGEDFYNLAYYNSDDRTRYVGGSLGQFHAGQTVKEFDAALSTMNAGDVSEPIQTIYGFHIIKLDAVEESRQLTFEEVSDMMKQQTRDMRRKEIFDAWMNEMKATFPLETYETK